MANTGRLIDNTQDEARRPEGRLRRVYIFVEDINGDPLYGSQITYTHPSLFTMTGQSVNTDITLKGGEAASVDIIEERGVPAGTLTVTYLDRVIFEGVPSDLPRRVDGDFEKTYQTNIAVPTDYVSVTSSPVDTIIVPTAFSTPAGLVVEWTNAGEFLYRVFGSRASELLTSNPVGHTYHNSYLITGLSDGDTVYVNIRAENASGFVGKDKTAHTFVYNKPSNYQGFIRRRALQSVELAPGATHQVDLREYAHVSKLPGDSTSEATRWSDVDIKYYTFGPAAVTIGQSNYNIDLSVAGGASPSDSVKVILVRLKRDDCAPFWLAFAAKVSASTNTATAYSTSGMYVSNHKKSYNFPIEKFVGADVAHVLITEAHRNAIQIATDLDLEPTDTSIAITPNQIEDGVPQFAVFKGNLGIGVLCFGADPDTGYKETPYLPSGVITKVENGSEWSIFNIADHLQSQTLIKGASWPRVFTTTLYNISKHYPPETVHYAVATYYQNTWFDQYQYPSDAILKEGKVIYRSGLETIYTEPTEPVLNNITTLITEKGTTLNWIAKNPVTSDEVLVDIPIYVKRSGQAPLRFTARNQLVLDSLIPDTVYTAYFFSDGSGTSRNFTTRKSQATATVTGSILSNHEYSYTYTIADTSAELVYHIIDINGDTHVGAGTYTFVSTEQLNTHSIRIIHVGGRSYTLNVDVVWDAPAQPVTFEEEIEVGRSIPASNAPMPVIGKVSYAGTNEQELAFNVYRTGTYRLVIEGGCPPGMVGALEDYSSAVFINADGQSLGNNLELTNATELGIRVSVTADSEGRSPVIYGVRVIPQ